MSAPEGFAAFRALMERAAESLHHGDMCDRTIYGWARDCSCGRSDAQQSLRALAALEEEAVVERVAKAMWERWANYDEKAVRPFDQQLDLVRNDWRDLARAALRAVFTTEGTKNG